MHRRRHPRGLSLIEIVVYITIVAMLMSAVAIYAVGAHKNAQVDTARLDVKNALTALELYRASKGSYPEPSAGFAPLIKARVIKTIPLDPWGHALTWELRDGEPVVTSLGADGQPGGTDEAADLTTLEGG
jgi:general secretion pathway protein G